MNTNTDSADAWLIHINEDQQCATSIHELQEVIQNPELKRVPLTPFYCEHLVFWRSQPIPVFNLSRLLYAKEMNDNKTTHRQIGIFAYQNAPGENLNYVALFLQEYPKRTTVTDSQACELPEDDANWQPIAISCFEYQGKATPILGIKTLSTYRPDVQLKTAI